MTTAAGLQIVEANEQHIPFIAWVAHTAARSHVGGRGSLFDTFVEEVEGESLRLLRALVETKTGHFLQYTNFLVATVDGKPAAALCGFGAQSYAPGALVRAMQEATQLLGWTTAEWDAGWQRAKPHQVATAHCQVDHVPGAWIVESVATLPEYRRQGLIDALLASMLALGRAKGAATAEVSVLIGNDAAQRAYEKAGFAVVQERRHPEYEAVIGCPGQRLLRRSIS